jgi:Astacin (Peptidase family M12A)
MRKLWFAIIDIVLLMAISYAESDGKTLRQSSWSFYLHLICFKFNLAAADEGVSAADESEAVLGDMILSDEQMKFLYSTDSSKRLGLTSPFAQWPNATVFYDVDKSVDEKGKELVIAAMNYIQNVSCVHFQPREEATQHYVLIKPGRACSSKVGRRGGAQQMIIDSNLCSKGSIIHELLHTLGFLHMVGGPDN